MKVLELIHSLTTNSEIDLNSEVKFMDCKSANETEYEVTSLGNIDGKVLLNNVYDTTPLRKRWYSVDEFEPPYGKDVIVHLANGTRCITHRTQKDYSKDKHDFMHQVYAVDVDYWIEIPEF